MVSARFENVEDEAAYQNQGSQRGIVCIWQVVDKCMQGVTALDVIVNAYNRSQIIVGGTDLVSSGQALTSCINKVRVVLRSKQRVGQIPKELFQ